jgi:hypothetical protein
MSGFLQSLVARAEGRLPVLERRPRALFETAPGVAAAVDEVQRTDMVTPSPTRMASGEAGVSQAAPRHIEAVLATTAHATLQVMPRRSGGEESAPTQATPQRGLLQPEPYVPVAHPVGLGVHPVVSGVPARDALPAMPSISAPTSLAAARVVNTGRRPNAEAPTQRARSDSRNGDADGTPQVKPNERHAAPTVGALQPQPMQTAQPAVLLARQQSRATPRREVPESTAPAAPAPVQISIGRVEIRATSGASADRPRAPGPAAPRLSLDDYLRRRNGAGR